MSMISRSLKLAAASVVLATLTGCAFVPEKVSLQPTVKTKKSNIGHGRKVAVNVVDTRADKDLGGRASGYGPAAKISLANDIGSVVRQSVYKGLRSQGFKPVANTADANHHLTVRITGLDYKSRAGFFTGSVDINCSLDASANNNRRNYEKVYRNNGTQNVFFTPSSDSDKEHINAALSDTLSQMFNDKGLIKFLAA